MMAAEGCADGAVQGCPDGATDGCPDRRRVGCSEGLALEGCSDGAEKVSPMEDCVTDCARRLSGGPHEGSRQLLLSNC